VSYSLDQLLSRLRAALSDGQTPFVWSDEEFIDYLDSAEDELTTQLPLLLDRETITYNAMDDYLPLPPYVVQVRRAHNGVAAVHLLNDEEWAGIAPETDYGRNVSSPENELKTGDTVEYLVTDTITGGFRMYPIPTLPGALVLTVVRRPKTPLFERGAFEVPQRIQQRCLATYAMFLAYSKYAGEPMAKALAADNFAVYSQQLEDLRRSTNLQTRRAGNVAYGGY
jgi:hypothetical protein